MIYLFSNKDLFTIVHSLQKRRKNLLRMTTFGQCSTSATPRQPFEWSQEWLSYTGLTVFRIFVFLINLHTSKSLVPILTLPHITNYFQKILQFFKKIDVLCQNGIWLDNNATYDKHFLFVFNSILKVDTSSIPIYDFYKTSLKQHLVVFKIMFTIFDCLDAYFQKIKKSQTHHDWLSINCG